MARYSIGKWFSKMMGRRNEDGRHKEKQRAPAPNDEMFYGHPTGRASNRGSTEPGPSNWVRSKTAPPPRSLRRPIDPTASSRECEACLDILPRPYFPMKPITPECGHPAGQVCRPCLGLSLQVQLVGLMDGGFTCPLCQAVMLDRDAKGWASPEVFERYKRLKWRRECAKIPNFGESVMR
ncbi:hypothetical protein BDV06DRAFT_93013 [Aspergillus oleicola]